MVTSILTQTLPPKRSDAVLRITAFLAWLLLCAPNMLAHAPDKTVLDAQNIDFRNDIIPVFTKLGCNSGACHGAAVGRGGFQLSLYGGDPAADFRSIVHQLEGRRVNLAFPEKSLILAKPSESIPHGGGYLVEEGHESEQLLLQWIRSGAPWNAQRKLLSIETTPERIVLADPEGPIKLRVSAIYTDGTARDVTQWTVLTPEDESSVQIDDSQAAHVLRPGRHIVIARYLDQVQPIEFLKPLSVVSQATTSEDDSQSFIDQEINASLQSLGLRSAPQADNATLLRRLSLDLVGRLPSSVKSLQAMKPAMHSNFDRDAVIQTLLDSPEFVQFLSMRFAQLFRNQPNRGGNSESTERFHDWIAEQLKDRQGYDEIARSLILATGNARQLGPASFYRIAADAKEQAEYFTELMMGSRLRCANCHNHPLDRWTQDDFHGLAAIFSRVQLGENVQLKNRGENIHPRTLEPADFRIPGEYSFEVETNQDPRQELADWLTASSNPYFSKAIVNRLWKFMMGRGLVDPVDDFRATNPASHPKLLELLAKDFVQHEYDIRHTLKVIVSSQAYSRRSDALEATPTNAIFYAQAARRSLDPEVRADAIGDVLEVFETYDASADTQRAVALKDPSTPSRTLDVLGRCDRTSSCESTGSESGGLPQQLHLLNGPMLNARIHVTQGRLRRLLADGINPTQIVQEFYRVAFTRSATEEESKFWNLQLSSCETEDLQNQVLEDFVWALLASEEFQTNH